MKMISVMIKLITKVIKIIVVTITKNKLNKIISYDNSAHDGNEEISNDNNDINNKVGKNVKNQDQIYGSKMGEKLIQKQRRIK